MRKKLMGIVAGDKMAKTRRVQIERVFRHLKYGKTMRMTKVVHVHDENEESKVGDRVEIVESRPLSKLKRWRLVRVVSEQTKND